METNELIKFFKYQNGLKQVARNNWYQDGRKESSAEHTWSVAMMAMLLAPKVAAEADTEIDMEKTIKMALVHDLVEIDAGDVGAWDDAGRAEVANKEMAAIDAIAERLKNIDAGAVRELWIEHDALETLEAKLVKACDQLCPLVFRVTFSCSYEGTGVDRTKLDSIFLQIVTFSSLLHQMYVALADEIAEQGLFDQV